MSSGLYKTEGKMALEAVAIFSLAFQLALKHHWEKATIYCVPFCRHGYEIISQAITTLLHLLIRKMKPTP